MGQSIIRPASSQNKADQEESTVLYGKKGLLHPVRGKDANAKRQRHQKGGQKSPMEDRGRKRL